MFLYGLWENPSTRIADTHKNKYFWNTDHIVAKLITPSLHYLRNRCSEKFMKQFLQASRFQIRTTRNELLDTSTN